MTRSEFSRFLVSEDDIFDAYQGGRPLKPNEKERFKTLGVTEAALVEPEPVLADLVIFGEDGSFFEFASNSHDELGELAFTFLVQSNGALIDIAAWVPSTGRFASWLQRAFALGENQIWQPRIGDDPIQVWRTPLAWLRAGRNGLFILRPKAVPHYAAYLPVIAAEDTEYGEALERMLLPAKPATKILIPVQTSNST